MTDYDDLCKRLREEWRDVVGHEGRYQVSSIGRVRAMRYRNRYHDSIRTTPLILAQRIRSGYLSVHLKKSAQLVHLLVIAAFTGPKPEGTEAGHLDGDSLHNVASNLAWVSKKENAQHRSIHGTQQRGERCYNAKLTEKAVKEIRATYRRRSRDANSRVLAERFGVSKEHIQKVVAGKAWSHI